MRLRSTFRAALLVLPFLARVSLAARPERDVSFDRPAAHPPSLDRLRADAAIGRVGTPLHVDERYGVPSFLWAGRLGGAAPVARAAGAGGAIDAARAHLARYGAYYRLDDGDVRDARVRWVHDIGSGGIIVSFQREVDGIEVFRDEMMVMMDRSLGLVAVSGYLPGQREAGSPDARVFRRSAAEAVGRALDDFAGNGFDRSLLDAAQAAEGGYETFALRTGGHLPAGLGAEPIRERRVLFHLPDRLEPAYYVEVMADTEAVAYVVSASDGALLFRHNLIANDVFSYRVWADATTLKAPLDGPQGNANTPHPTGTPNNLNPSLLAPTLSALQNGPISTNDPWLAAGATVTNGNNVDAYADLNSPDGLSAGDFRASTTSANTFDRTYDTNLAPGSSNGQQQAAVTQLFYNDNFFHDWYYDAGFNEASGNAQTSNLGRGGVQGDNLRAEAQDFSGTNNANMTTPADGGHPKMQMYVFNNTGVRVQLNSPGSIAGSRVASNAVWGPQTFNVTADVVQVNDGTGTTSDGCEVFGGVAGKIALIDRGTCTFITKVQNAQNAGAVGVIIVNNIAPGTLVMGGTPTITITIPAVMISLSDGIDVKHALLSGAVNATLIGQTGLSRDGTIDNQIVAHEWGHYISNRLIGNASGLSNIQGQGMGEGWGDFHAMLLTVKPEDSAAPGGANFAGVYALSAYALSNTAIPDNAYYFGIRRYPYSTDMTKNPLTFKHIQNNTPLPVGPPVAFGSDGASNAEVHNTGEVWCSMLWECYAALLRDTGRLTFDQARDRMRSYLVAGYKMTPNAPTFTQARDAILSAALAADPTDYKLFCAAFAKRGAGQGAVSPPSGSTTNLGVTESYTICGGELTLTNALLDDAVQNCDADGVLDASESGHFSVTLRNVGNAALSATTATLSSTNPSVVFTGGANLVFPPSAPNATTSAVTAVYSSGASGIQSEDIQIQFDDPGLAFAGPRVSSFAGRGNTDLQASSTETVEAPSPPWTMTGPVTTAQEPWRVQAVTALDHRFYAPGASGVSDQYLISPSLAVGAGPFSFTFQHAYLFEASSTTNRDGGVIELSTDGGANWVDIGASVSPGYSGTITTVSASPLAGRSAFVGTSPGYPALATATASLGTTYAGQNVMIRFRLGSDQATGSPGWSIDNLAFSGLTGTPFLDVVADPGPCALVGVGGAAPGELTFRVDGANPSVGGSRFRFALPKRERVCITIHDVAGRRVATLADGTFEAGVHTALWQANRGGTTRSGVYFARMTADGRELERRLVLLAR